MLKNSPLDLILLGPYSPVALSDYGSGTNHVLPTGGFAQSFSGLSALDFMRRVSIVESTRTGLERVKDSIKTIDGSREPSQSLQSNTGKVRKMSESYKKWIKQKLEKLQAIDCYSAGATPETVAKQLGVTTKQIIKLDFNENLFMPRVKQAKLMKELAEEIDLRMYPEDEEAKLREKLAGYMKVPKEFLVVGNASDELIDRIIRLFVEKGDIAVSFTPTFSIPRLCVKRQEGEYIQVPLLSNLQLDVKGMLSKFSDKTRLLYLCSPNSPTATQYKARRHRSFSQSFPRHSHLG